MKLTLAGAAFAVLGYLLLRYSETKEIRFYTWLVSVILLACGALLLLFSVYEVFFGG